MKTPISYYGGKQQLVTTLLGMIPPHKIYCEVALFSLQKENHIWKL